MACILIYNELDKRDISPTKISEKIGINRSTLNRFLNGKTTPNLEDFLKIVREVCPEKEFSAVSKFAEKVTKRSDVLSLLEYSSIHRLLDALELLIAKCRESGNAEMAEWADLYEISLKFQRYEDVGLSHQLRAKKVKSEAMECFKWILRMHIAYSEKKYETALEIAQDIEMDVDGLPAGFVKESYKTRLAEIFAHTYFRVHNEMEKSREYANWIIKNTKSKIYEANALITLGTTHMFDDFSKAEKSLIKAREIQKEIGVSTKETNDKILFLRNYWNKQDSIPDKEFIEGYAHYCAINNIENNRIDELETYHSNYIKWLDTKNKEFLYKALSQYKSHKDSFHINNLILHSLVKAGENPFFVAAACQI